MFVEIFPYQNHKSTEYEIMSTTAAFKLIGIFCFNKFFNFYNKLYFCPPNFWAKWDLDQNLWCHISTDSGKNSWIITTLKRLVAVLTKNHLIVAEVWLQTDGLDSDHVHGSLFIATSDVDIWIHNKNRW